MPDLSKPCPFCQAVPGQKCFTYFNGIHLVWDTETHKARKTGKAEDSYRRRF